MTFLQSKKLIFVAALLSYFTVPYMLIALKALIWFTFLYSIIFSLSCMYIKKVDIKYTKEVNDYLIKNTREILYFGVKRAINLVFDVATVTILFYSLPLFWAGLFISSILVFDISLKRFYDDFLNL